MQREESVCVRERKANGGKKKEEFLFGEEPVGRREKNKKEKGGMCWKVQAEEEAL